MPTLTADAPTVNPVTAADVKRARYFGLTIPAPAPVAVAELAPEVPAANPRDSWPSWCDEDTWTTEATPEAEDFRPTSGPDPEPEGHSLADEAWFAGFTLARDGEDPAYPMGGSWGRADRVAFLVGRDAGREALRRETEADRDEIQGRDARFEAWVREMERVRGLDGSEARETDGYAPGYCS